MGLPASFSASPAALPLLSECLQPGGLPLKHPFCRLTSKARAAALSSASHGLMSCSLHLHTQPRFLHGGHAKHRLGDMRGIQHEVKVLPLRNGHDLLSAHIGMGLEPVRIHSADTLPPVIVVTVEIRVLRHLH